MSERNLTITYSQRRVLDALQAANGKVVSYKRLLEAMQVDCPEKPMPKPNTLKVQVHYLRQAIRAVPSRGFDIETVHDHGYRLIQVVDGEDAV